MVPFEVHPGGEPHPPALAARLAEAVERLGPAWRPRTHHLRPDGGARFVNRLILERSPYLLQHAHNPVDWMPWGEEAFELARRLDRPVLLSVGYSTCHWCHVMERESFEDEEIASLMNQLYVCVKVDREVRPDVDHVYMSAVQALTKRGGWPMTVWLAPDRRPYFGGTYFPPRGGMRGMGMGFNQLLVRLAEAWRDERAKVEEAGARLVSVIHQMEALPPGPGVVGLEALGQAWAAIARGYDPINGGFGGPPRFPMPPTLRLGLVLNHLRRDAEPLVQVTHTLRRMAGGGIYDHLAGGFHRYSTDDKWLVPHFEKMLYDQALLISVYLDAFLVTGDPSFEGVIRETIEYIRREMTGPNGAFYAATDADSEGEEGTFFLWTPEEVDDTLDPQTARIFKLMYDVRRGGNWEGRNILHTPRSVEEVARLLNEAPERVREASATGRQALYERRSRREAPHLDDKHLVEWGAMTVEALARAGSVLGEPAWILAAERALTALLDAPDAVGRLVGDPAVGYLEDAAWVVSAAVTLFEATGEVRWLDEALRRQAWTDTCFWDEEGGGYFRTPHGAEALLVRDKPVHDGVVPSGNAVAARNLLRLEAWTGDTTHRDRAAALLRAFSSWLTEAPQAVPALVEASAHLHAGPAQVILALPMPPASTPLLAQLRRAYLPFTAVAAFTPDQLRRAEASAPVLAGKAPLGGAATAWVCQAGRCELPTTDPAVFAAQLGR